MVMKSKKLLIGVAAVALAFPTAAGILAAGAAWAQQTPTQPPAQSQPAQTPPTNGAESGSENETPPTLPPGSASQDAAQQAATVYVQQTAPYSTQGLIVTAVHVDDEDGTAVYKVTFGNASGRGAEVTVSAQGQVLKAEADGAGEHKSGGQDAETNDGPDTGGQAIPGPSGQ
jgi:hypothetical protein